MSPNKSKEDNLYLSYKKLEANGEDGRPNGQETDKKRAKYETKSSLANWPEMAGNGRVMAESWPSRGRVVAE